MLRSWYIPNSAGDYRLEADPESPLTRSILTIENPTVAEIEILEGFLRICTDGRRKWLPKGTTFRTRGRESIVIKAPMSKCGPKLAGALAPERGTLTVIVSQAGTVTQTVAVESAADIMDNQAQLAKAAAAPTAERAVTVRRGTVCCPHPVSGPLKLSSQVLRLFLTTRQWRQWVDHRCVDVIGGITGRLYRVFHRHHPTAILLGQPILDVEACAILHRWDYSVPPAEEVLGAVLILQHKEAWIRNASGAYGGELSELLPNPVGYGGADGTWDALLFRSFGVGYHAAKQMLAHPDHPGGARVKAIVEGVIADPSTVYDTVEDPFAPPDPFAVPHIPDFV